MQQAKQYLDERLFCAYKNEKTAMLVRNILFF